MIDDLKELLATPILRRWLTRSPQTPMMTAARPLWWTFSSGALRTRWTLTTERLSTVSVNGSTQRDASIQRTALMMICSPRTP